MKELDAEAAIRPGATVLQNRLEATEAVLEELYHRHARALYRYALALLGSADDAEDAVQEVFVRIARSGRRLGRIGNTKAYLYSATRNAAYSVLRSKKRRNETDDEALSGLTADMEPPTDAIALQESFAQLPMEQREALVLKIYDEMTFDEIARTIGVSINTAASRYRYGIERLRRALEEDRNG